MKKKALFIPNDMGGGLGHVRRCLHLAEVLKSKGWDIGFLIHQEKSVQHIDSAFKILRIQFPLEKWQVIARSKFSPIHYFPENKLKKIPYFWEFNSLNYQVLRDGYFTPTFVQKRFQKLSKAVDEWKPDIIINDGHLLSFFLGKKFNIPVFQIVRFAVFPDPSTQFIWWKTPPDTLRPPPSTRAFDALFDKIGEPPCDEATLFLQGDAYLIPGNPSIEPISTEKPHLFFGYHVHSVWDQRLIQIDRKERKKKIYVTIGGGSHRSHVNEYYQFLVESLHNQNAQIIFSDPFEILHRKLNKSEHPHISVFKWIDSSTIFPYLNLIIHHGGYSTFMESLWWGVPSLIIPFHSEQEGNGRRLEKLNAGKVMHFASEAKIPVKFKSFYGDFTMLGSFERAINKDQFVSALQTLLTDQDYKQAAVDQSQNLQDGFDYDKIADFITQYS
ncbi:MAG: hypothetical protein Kow0042_06540 [Calditrichia bacterium]